MGRGALAPCLPWARGRARVNSRARVQERRWQAGWVIFGAWQGCCCRRGGGVLARPRGVSLLASWQAPRQLARLRVAKPTQVLDRELAACLSPCLPTPPLSLIPDFTPLHARSKAPRLVNVSARAPAIAPGARVLVCAARARPRSFALPTMPWSRAASWEGARGGAMDGMTGAPRVATLGCIPDRRSPLRAPPPVQAAHNWGVARAGGALASPAACAAAARWTCRRRRHRPPSATRPPWAPPAALTP